MNRIARILYVLFAGALYACNTGKGHDRFAIIQLPSPADSIQHIQVPVADSLSFDYNKQLQDIRFLQLQKTEASGIVNIDKIFFSKNRIVILDKQVAGSVFIFDTSGKFIAKISAGDVWGRKKLKDVFDACYYYNKDEVLIYDYKSKEVFRFNTDGAYTGSSKPPFAFYSFYNIKHTDDFLYRDLKNEAQIEPLRNMDIFVATSKDSIYLSDKTQQAIETNGGYFTQSAVSSYNSNSLFYTPLFSDTAYFINAGAQKIYPGFVFHYPGASIKSKLQGHQKVTTSQINMLRGQPHNYTFDGDVLYNNENVYYFKCYDGGKACHYFYSAATHAIIGGQVITRLNSTDTSYAAAYMYPIATTDSGEFVSVMSLQNYWPDKRVIKSHALNSVLEKTGKEDNPILLIYKLRNF